MTDVVVLFLRLSVFCVEPFTVAALINAVVLFLRPYVLWVQLFSAAAVKDDVEQFSRPPILYVEPFSAAALTVLAVHFHHFFSSCAHPFFDAFFIVPAVV